MTATSACQLQQWCILQTGHPGVCSEVPVKTSAPEALASAISALASAHRRLMLAREAWRAGVYTEAESWLIPSPAFRELGRAEEALESAIVALLVVAGVDQ